MESNKDTTISKTDDTEEFVVEQLVKNEDENGIIETYTFGKHSLTVNMLT